MYETDYQSQPKEEPHSSNLGIISITYPINFIWIN